MNDRRGPSRNLRQRLASDEFHGGTELTVIPIK